MCDMYVFFRELMMENVTTSGKRRPCTKYYTIKKPIQQTRRGCLYGSNLFLKYPPFAAFCPDMP